jgi:O-antigen/teichoic acid export membrane protein
MWRRLRDSRFARDAATLQVAAGVTAVGNLTSTVLLAFLLGPTMQGTYYLATAVYSLFYLIANVGLQTVTVSHVARAVGAGDRRGIVAWLGFLLKGGFLLGAGLFVLAELLLPTISGHFYDDPRVGQWAVWLCLSPLIEVPRMVAAAAFQGTRRMFDLAQLDNFVELGRVFFVVSGILTLGGAEGAVIGTLAASALGSVVAYLQYQRVRRELMADPEIKAVLPSVRELLGGTRMITLRQGLPQGIQVGFMRNLDALALDVAPLLLMGHFGTVDQVAYFRMAQRFLRAPLTLLQGISRTAVPALSQLAKAADPSRFRTLFYRASVGGGLLIGSGIATVLLLIPYVCHTLLAPEYWDTVPHYVYLLAFGFFVTGFSGALESFYIAAHRVKQALRIGVLIGGPLILSMAIGGHYYGADGVVVGCALTLSIGFAHHLYIWRCFQGGTPILVNQRLDFSEASV